MQEKNLKLKKIKISAVPFVEDVMSRIGFRETLGKHIKGSRQVEAIAALVKNFLIEPAALYRIPQWAQEYYGDNKNPISDDLIGKALDRLFEADRSTLQTQITAAAVAHYNVDLSQIHNDSTSIKTYGAHKNQDKRAVTIKRGFSKDHRPDLKQVLYNLSMSADGGVPVHFKLYDGNTTDDTTHVENWIKLRSFVGGSDFLYVADSKLCTAEQLRKIDREQGRFVTVVPDTRSETKEFYEECHQSSVRWKVVARKPPRTKNGKSDTFYAAEGFYQLKEGFRLHW